MNSLQGSPSPCISHFGAMFGRVWKRKTSTCWTRVAAETAVTTIWMILTKIGFNFSDSRIKH